MLGFYGVQSGMEIHVIDNDPFSLSRMGGLEDVSKIQKYRMSEEDYDKVHTAADMLADMLAACAVPCGSFWTQTFLMRPVPPSSSLPVRAARWDAEELDQGTEGQGSGVDGTLEQD